MILNFKIFSGPTFFYRTNILRDTAVVANKMRKSVVS